MLTLDDNKWLEDLRQSFSSSMKFYLAHWRGNCNTDQLAELAGQVLIYHDGTFITAHDLSERIIGTVHNSMIYEQWHYWCAEAVYHAASVLPDQDALVLLYASGFADVSASELAAYSAEAVNEVRQELYGDI
jgi:hypothetical protein